MQDAARGIRLTARLVDTPANEMHTDAFVEVCPERLGLWVLVGRYSCELHFAHSSSKTLYCFILAICSQTSNFGQVMARPRYLMPIALHVLPLS